MFSEQVKETEKEAQNCLRRIVARQAHAKASSTSLIDTLVEREVEPQDLLDIWKQSRHALEKIDCAFGTAPLLTLDQSREHLGSSLPLESTVWRDHESIPFDGFGDETLMLAGSEDFVAIPRAGPMLDWNQPVETSRWHSSVTEGMDEQVDAVRGEPLLHRESIHFPLPSLMDSYGDVSIHDAPSTSTHFLDLLIDKHDETMLGDDESILRSALSASEVNLQQKLDDLLAPSPFGSSMMMDEQLLRSLYDERDDGDVPYPPFPDHYYHGNDEDRTGDAQYGDIIDGNSYLDAANHYEIVGDESSAGLIGDESTTEPRKMRKVRRVLMDDGPLKMAHEESRKWIDKFGNLPPRADAALLSDAAQLDKHVRKAKLNLKSRTFADVAKVMGMPKGESFLKKGAWAYVHLLHSTRLSADLSSNSIDGSIDETGEPTDVSTTLIMHPYPSAAKSDSIHNPNDLLGVLGQLDAMESSGSLNGTTGHQYTYDNDDDRDDGRDWIRPEGDTVAAAPGVLSSIAVISSEDSNEKRSTVQFGDLTDTQPLLLGDESVALQEVSASQQIRRGSSILSSLNRSEYDGQRQQQSSKAEVRGLSKALLGYLAFKASTAEPQRKADGTNKSRSGSMNGSMTPQEEEDAGDASLTSSTPSSISQSQLSRPGNALTVSRLLHGAKRRTAARTFFHLLELANANQIELDQEQLYGEISIHVIAE